MYERAQAAQQQDASRPTRTAPSANGAGAAAEEEVVDAEVVDEQK